MSAVDGGRRALSRVRPEVFADFELHAVQLGQVPAGGKPVILRGGFRVTELLDLPLEALDTLEHRLVFLFAMYHGSVTSTMPRRVPSRLSCQSPMAARS